MASDITGQRSASPQEKAMVVSEQSSSGSFAFLVHSQDTLNNNLPPNVDNHPLARQKRRRTSPEDQAMLEAEYEKNSKPDKAARLDIVKRVALGEKEVQIWFQNRRQITRRKSRPFSSQDSGISDVFSSQDSSGTAAYSSFSLPDVSDELLPTQSTVQQSQSVLDSASPMLLGAVGDNKPNPKSPAVETEAEEQSAASVRSPPEKTVDASVEETVNAQSSSANLFFPPVAVTTSAKSRPGLAKRRSSSFIIHQDCAKSRSSSAAQPDGANVMPYNATSLPSTLRRSSSLLKLSTSFDGKAKLISGSESPSPPKLRAPRPVTCLQRSQSAIEPSRPPEGEIPLPSFKSPKRLMTGRSRDARTWEFYCDNDARDALTEQAEREATGSAAGAIGLIRSRSNKVLSSNPNKRNVNAQKPDSFKRLKAGEPKTQKRKLNRTTSSVARLQTVTGGKQGVNPGQKKPKSGSQTELLVESGDSDKENWEPGTQTRIHRRRRAANPANPTRRPQSVLRESLEVPSHSSSLDAFLNREDGNSQREDEENSAGLDAHEEVADLVGDIDLPREPDDLDCVQNLLSLRQGAWQ